MLLGTTLLWAGYAGAAGVEQGKTIYTEKCASCHGPKGDGKGPVGASCSPAPTNFTDPKFWQQANLEQTLRETINNGKGAMPAQELKPEEIKAVMEYLKTFKK